MTAVAHSDVFDLALRIPVKAADPDITDAMPPQAAF